MTDPSAKRVIDEDNEYGIVINSWNPGSESISFDVRRPIKKLEFWPSFESRVGGGQAHDDKVIAVSVCGQEETTLVQKSIKKTFFA